MYKNKFEFNFNKKKFKVNKPKLNGDHQIENASVALAFSQIISQKKIKIRLNKTNIAIKEAFWPGRIEILNYNNKKIILDGSHNIDGAKKLKQYLKSKKLKPIVIFGMLNNKKIDSFLSTIKNEIKSVLAIKIPYEKNSFLTSEIIQKCNLLKIKCFEVISINDALKLIKKSKKEIYLITGSLYLVGKIRNKFL